MDDYHLQVLKRPTTTSLDNPALDRSTDSTTGGLDRTLMEQQRLEKEEAEDSLEEVSSAEMEEYNRISDNEIWDQVTRVNLGEVIKVKCGPDNQGYLGKRLPEVGYLRTR